MTNNERGSEFIKRTPPHPEGIAIGRRLAARTCECGHNYLRHTIVERGGCQECECPEWRWLRGVSTGTEDA